MTIQDEEKIRDDLKFYSDRNISVHIVSKKLIPNTLKNIWHNGKTKTYYDNYIEFNDEDKGLIPIHFCDIKDVIKREEKR